MRRRFLVAMGLAGCAHTGLTARIEALEARLKTLEVAVRTGGANGPVMMAAGAAAPAQPDVAASMLADATRLAREGRVEEPRTLLRELITAYPDSPSAAAARKLYAELQIVGQPAPSLDGTTWLQGAAPADPRATLYVFFEAWCPHCRNHLPKTQAQANVWSDNGLAVIGLTRMTRDVTPEQVLGLAGELGLRFPIGRATETLWQGFGVSGVPAAAVVRDGAIAWRGHPANLSDDVLRELLPAEPPVGAGGATPTLVPTPAAGAPTDATTVPPAAADAPTPTAAGR
ncbi:MAG: Redoxin [Pseudomonadota bacterium]